MGFLKASQLLVKKRYFSRIYLGLGLFVMAIGVGIVGFMNIEDYNMLDAFYMTVITISTVGFTEVHELSREGRLFTSILILSNIGIFAYAVSTITSFIFDGEFRSLFKDYKVNQKIEQLKNHVIVCGYGRNGKKVCEELQLQKQAYVVIEKKDTLISELRDTMNQLFIEGDATDDQVLHSARLEHARALVATLPSDADNVFVTLTARQANPKLLIISRASDDPSVGKLRLAGADNVIMPEHIGGSHMAALVTQPDIMEFIALISGQGGVSISFEEIAYEEMGKHFQNKTLKELDIRSKTGANIIGVKHENGDYTINPDAEEVIGPHSKLIVLGNEKQLGDLKMLLLNHS